MSKLPAITINNISKKFTLQQPIKDDAGNETHELWALKNISLEIYRGETVGIIGTNGSGKSTLLKILAGITSPTLGEVEIYGRVASILDIGSGFHQELSGRENVFLNGQLLGFTKTEIKDKFSEIVSFSGIEKFIDEPVKNYSNGMYLRLAFSIMAHLDFDVYLIDEVISVGDVEFTRKAKKKFQKLATEGKTILLASHNIAELYDQDIFVQLDKGILKEVTKRKNILLQYVENNSKADEQKIYTTSVELTDFSNYPNSKDVEINRVRLFQESFSNSEPFRTDKAFTLEVQYEKLKDSDTIDILMGISEQQGNIILSSSQFVSGDFSDSTQKQTYVARCVIHPNIFNSQVYKIGLNFLKNLNKELLHNDTNNLLHSNGFVIENTLKLPNLLTFKPVFLLKENQVDLSSINIPGHLLMGFEWE